MDDYKGEDHREHKEHCDDCVRGDFGTIKKLVFFILVVVVGSRAWGQYELQAQEDITDRHETAIALLSDDFEEMTVTVGELVDAIQDDKEQRRLEQEREREQRLAEQRELIETLKELKK
jgi:hypothetical protein